VNFVDKGDQACGMWESRKSQTLANRGTWNYFKCGFIHVYLQSDNCFIHRIPYFMPASYFYLAPRVLLFYLTSTSFT